MKIIDKDILTISEGIICHQVNCKKVMGAGLALRIRNKFPIVYEEYKKYNGKLGDVQVIVITKNLSVANLYGQDRYGRDRCYTDYDALKECFKKLSAWDQQIYIPNGMGCRLGGGDWNIVCAIVEEMIPTAIICNYN